MGTSNGKSIALGSENSVSINISEVNIPANKGILTDKESNLNNEPLKEEKVLKDSGAIQIHIKTLPGKVITLDVKAFDSIDSIKKILQEKESIPQDVIRLIFSGQLLESGRSLADYNIQDQSVITLLTCTLRPR